MLLLHNWFIFCAYLLPVSVYVLVIRDELGLGRGRIRKGLKNARSGSGVKKCLNIKIQDP